MVNGSAAWAKNHADTTKGHQTKRRWQKEDKVFNCWFVWILIKQVEKHNLQIVNRNLIIGVCNSRCLNVWGSRKGNCICLLWSLEKWCSVSRSKLQSEQAETELHWQALTRKNVFIEPDGAGAGMFTVCWGRMLSYILSMERKKH